MRNGHGETVLADARGCVDKGAKKTPERGRRTITPTSTADSISAIGTKVPIGMSIAFIGHYLPLSRSQMQSNQKVNRSIDGGERPFTCWM
jgi:hypothetical protein